MNHFKKPVLATAALSIVVLGACSADKEPTLGERLQGQGVEVQAIGKKWSKGEDLVSDGNKLVKEGNKEIAKGEKLLSKGENKVKKGEAMIKKGTRLKADAEESYNSSTSN